ncbi:MAG: NADH-quinone oxidoreductase subunit J [Alphaproteobacteria bacterium MarineAlpha9_Bin4]|nr:MAG: NADH-quinone oxidoreductase subunit J [Alphaproteobacteria bacterium MarineAlpha9_Bin4]|tara:strand:- start:1641 stop:2222 length:582 start_codon:yes stop_codon:yes gene_type:complete
MILFFFLFSAVTVLSSIAVISSRNPVHSVFFLILAFVNSAGIFVLAGAEFLAMILLIVYVGAVAVLFLFVVMMLNVGVDKIKTQTRKYMLSGFLVAIILLFELIFSFANLDIIIQKPENNLEKNTNTHALGNVLYTDYFLPFQVSGCILLVAMLGAIILTLRKREGVLRQNISEQVSRTKEDSIKIVKIGKKL